MKIAIAKLNQTVGKIEENTSAVMNCIDMAENEQCDLIVFPEFAICGGYCDDLFLNKNFIERNVKAANILIKESNYYNIPAVCGTVTKDGKGGLLNSVSVFYGPLSTTVTAKSYFDKSYFNQAKYFSPDPVSRILKIVNKNFLFCMEDNPQSIRSSILNAYQNSKVKPETVFILNCSPYYAGKIEEFKTFFQNIAVEYKIDIGYVNMLGGHDGYFFDGLALYVNKEGKFKLLNQSFDEGLLVFDTDKGLTYENKQNNQLNEIYNVLILGLQEYCRKNGFKKVALGISGGIDSALVAAIAVDALGKNNVLGVLMPSKYTSKESMDYSIQLCKNLKIKYETVPIDNIYNAYINECHQVFKETKKDLTEENIQARIRGNILMSFSNKFGYFILCTCNKSEDAVGYSTLYGDMAGGYSVIGDLLKKDVYALANYRNTVSNVIPEEIIKRPPTAELRENQKDSDSLPEYDILDDILEKILEKNMSYENIIKSGVDTKILDKVYKLLFSSEYKRRQSPISTKVTKTSFIKDIKFPMTNKYKICKKKN